MKGKYYVLIVVGLFLFALFLITQFSHQAVKRGTVTVADLKTASVVRGDIIAKIRATGIVSATESVKVTSEVSAKVKEITKEEGGEVRKGELLVRLDQTKLLNELKQAEINIRKARLQLEDAQAKFDSNKPLFAKGFIPKKEWEDIKMKLQLAKVGYEEAQNEEALVRDKLEKVNIIAPVSGTITDKYIDEGEVVVGIRSGASPTTILVVANLTQKKITCSINQFDITSVEVGQPVQIKQDMYPDAVFMGKVSKIAPKAVGGEGHRFFSVDIELIKDDPRIRLGTTVKIFIITGSRHNILKVPIEAIFEETESGEFCFVKKKFGGWEKRLVTTGISDFFHTEIIEGLEEGDAVFLEDPRD